MNKYQKIFLTFFYTGLSPKAPGTVGTLASIPFGLLFLHYLGPWLLMLITIVTTIVAICVVDSYEAITETHDNQQIVIDETVGVWTTILITSFFVKDILILSILSFLLFRLYDITKPLFISYIDKEISGGNGVILDDILAGIFAGITNIIIIYFLF